MDAVKAAAADDGIRRSEGRDYVQEPDADAQTIESVSEAQVALATDAPARLTTSLASPTARRASAMPRLGRDQSMPRAGRVCRESRSFTIPVASCSSGVELTHAQVVPHRQQGRGAGGAIAAGMRDARGARYRWRYDALP